MKTAVKSKDSISSKRTISCLWRMSMASCHRNQRDNRKGRRCGGAHIARSGPPVRAVVRDAARARSWAERGCEVVTADMDDNFVLTLLHLTTRGEIVVAQFIPSLEAHKYLRAKVTACSWDPGWLSIMLRAYDDQPQAHEFITQVTLDNLK